MSQEDSFEQDGSAGLTQQVDAQGQQSGGKPPDPDKEGVVGPDNSGGPDDPGADDPGADDPGADDPGAGRSGPAEPAWQSHGGDAPSRGPSSDGMAEPAAGPDGTRAGSVGPDGELVDPDVSDGGQSGQDSGSMS